MLARKIFLVLIICLAFPTALNAARKEIIIAEMSSSGRTLKINAGMNDGLHLREAILLRSEDTKIAAARVIRLSPDQSVVYIVEAYGSMGLQQNDPYNILYGIPLDNIPDLPDEMNDINAAQDKLPDNPQDEKFFTPDGREVESKPDIDDDHYTPEVSLRPKFPDSTDYNSHNITVGVGLFRNRDLQQQQSPGANNYATTSYQGYLIRYAYTWRTNYWLRKKTPALLSVEAGAGTYSFVNTFADGTVGQINVIPLSLNLRYLVEVNKLFRLYPYIGYQNNIVPAATTNAAIVRKLAGGRLLGGGGAQLLLSKSMDARVDAGTDGVLLGLVTKF